MASVAIAPARARDAGLAYLALGDWHGTREIAPATWYAGTPEPEPVEEPRPRFAGRKAGRETADRSRADGPMTLLRISVGKEDSVRPADLVGAIAGEARISSSVIGTL